MDEVASKAIRDLKIGDLSLGLEAAITEQKTDIQTQLLQETRQKLFGCWLTLLSFGFTYTSAELYPENRTQLHWQDNYIRSHLYSEYS